MFISLPFHPALSQLKSVQAVTSYFCPYNFFQLPLFIGLIIPLFQYLFSLRLNVIYTHILVSELSRRHLLLQCYTAKDVEKGPHTSATGFNLLWAGVIS
jgi:hypothetical protein